MDAMGIYPFFPTCPARNRHYRRFDREVPVLPTGRIKNKFFHPQVRLLFAAKEALASLLFLRCGKFFNNLPKLFPDCTVTSNNSGLIVTVQRDGPK